MVINDLNVETRVLTGPEGDIRLPTQSFIILHTLLAADKRMVSREALAQALWPDEKPINAYHRTFRAVKRLQARMHQVGYQPGEITRIFGKGYAIGGTSAALHKLTPLELKVARTLSLKRGQIVPHRDIRQAIWHGSVPDRAPQIIRAAVYNIRHKLGISKSTLRPVVNVGYFVGAST